MNDDTNDNRREALDQFANATATGGTSVAVQPAAQNILGGQVFGAQAVAVHRDTRRVLAQIKELAAAAGADWYYRFPVKDNKTGTTQWIEGPTIKLANDIARMYGNCEVDCRASDLGSTILYHARFVDLETGYALTRPFQQRKGASKLGGADAGRREDITFQIGASKAIRNVVVNALQTYADFAFEEAKNALVERIGKDLERWRSRTAEKLAAKVDLRRVEAVIGRPAAAWLAGDVARIIAMGKAVEDGMSTWDETFPRPGAANDNTPHDPVTGEVLDQFAAGASQANTGSAQAAEPDEAAMFPSAGPAATDVRVAMIENVLKLANSPEPPDARIEILDITQHMLTDHAPQHAGFIKTAVETAAKVVRGEIAGSDAKKYLEGLIK